MIQNPIVPPNNNIGAVLTLTAASASGSSATYTNATAIGIQVGINVTGITGTSPTLQVTIEGIDPVSGTTFTVLQSASITADGYTVLTVYPGIAATANVSDNGVLPYLWKLAYTIGGTTPAVTATISAVTLV